MKEGKLEVHAYCDARENLMRRELKVFAFGDGHVLQRGNLMRRELKVAFVFEFPHFCQIWNLMRRELKGETSQNLELWKATPESHEERIERDENGQVDDEAHNQGNLMRRELKAARTSRTSRGRSRPESHEERIES